MIIKNDPLQLRCAQNISVSHCFTTRMGGVSTGHLKSLNLSVSRGDSLENVQKNYEIIGNALGFSPENLVLTHQIHTDIIRTVTHSDAGKGVLHSDYPDCDGLITDTPGLALSVFTADCTPILFWDPVTGAVGAAHAGWRGTALDIAGKTVRAMESAFGARPETICAAIGPNIGPCCFETGPEVPAAMLETFGKEAQTYIRPSGDKFFVDLKGLNALSLARAGVINVDISRECTFCSHEIFWSHRYTGGRRGSQGAFIVCRKETP